MLCLAELLPPAYVGNSIEVEPTTVILDEEVDQHPIGSGLATFFSDITGLNYDQIMAAHNKGTGFGVISQALWLTMKFEGDSEIFLAIFNAKETGDYSAFIFDDGITPKNSEQLRKAILDSSNRKDNPGIVMTNKDKEDDNRNNHDKEKNKDKDNNGNDSGKKNDNGNGNGNGKNK